MQVSMIISWLINLLFYRPEVFCPLFYPGLVTILALLLFIIWLERKIAGKVQLRYGPLYVTRKAGGVLQLLADLLRYLFQEPIIPKTVDKIAFIAGPVLLFTTAYVPAAILPATAEFTGLRSDLSLLAVLALLTLAPIFDMIIGWGSNNKFSLIGSLREGYLVMSYEIPMFLSTLAIAMVYGSLDLVEIVEMQRHYWGILLNPIAAITFLLVALMSTARFPFEIAEAETEIVMGPYTEYSGILYGLLMGASYVKFYVLSMLFALLFLGGWHPGITWLEKIHPAAPGLVVFIKALIIMVFGIFLRAVYPRFRVDQAIRIGWHMLFVLSMLSIVYSLAVIWLVG